MKKIAGIWLPDEDTHFERHLIEGELYGGKGSYQLTKITKALAQKEAWRVAYDIGAHVGLWSRVLARHCDQVCAFEPSRDLVRCLRKNLDGIENVQIFNCALGHITGIEVMHNHLENSGNTCILPSDFDYTSITCSIKMYRLDDMQDLPPPDLVKIDVEGYELRVLEGGEKTIRDARPVLVVEQKPGNAEKYGIGQFDAIKLLEAWGARQLWVKSGDYCYGW